VPISKSYLVLPLKFVNKRRQRVKNRVHGRLVLSVAFAISVVMMLGVVVFAAGGDLDTTFNGSGKVTTAIGSNNDGASAIVLQPDGKIVVAGDSFGATRDFALARYNVDGSLDSSFDGDGKLTTDFGNTGDAAYAVAIQPDGKIIAAGNSVGTSSAFALVRYNQNGSLDTSFGVAGKVTTNIASGNSDSAYAVAVQSDGKIIAAGSDDSSGGSHPLFALVRYNPDGSLDTSFGGTGKVTTAFDNFQNIALAVAIQTDGKIVAAGFSSYGSAENFALARYNPNGSLDSSFDGDGKVTTDFGATDDRAYSVAVQSNGKIVAAGYASNGSPAFALARYNINGALDSSFGGTGKVTTSFGGLEDIAHAISLQSDGKIVAAGHLSNGPGYAFALARYNSDSSLDTSFGDTGKVTTSFSNNSGMAQAVAIEPDGKIIAAGNAYNGTNTDFALARFLPAPGALSFSASSYSIKEGDGDATITLKRTGGSDNKVVAKVRLTDVTTTSADYRSPGMIDTSFNSGTGANNVVRATVVQTDGKVIIAGNFTTYNGVSLNRIARINPDGSLDTSFDPGTSTVNRVIWATALQADNKIIIGGAFTSYNGTSRNYIARLNPNGSLDASFDPGAGANGAVKAIALQPDGKVIISGSFTTYNGTPRKFIARLNPDGSLDTTFDPSAGTDSEVFTTALQTDGKIIIGGYFTNFNGISRNYVARLNSNGSLDTSFNPVTNPYVPGAATDSALYSLAVQADGKILIGGVSFINDGTSLKIYYIARLNPDGSLDTTFDSGTGPDDYVQTIALQPDGKIIIGGFFTSYNGNSINCIARLNSNGSLDTSFDPGSGAHANVYTTSLQTDGRIIIGGDFTPINGIPYNRLARLNGDLFVAWAAGDATDKTISLPVIDDSTPEPSETLTLSLVPLTGGATTGANPTAILTIVDNNDSSISNVSGSEVFKGTATLTATLASLSSPLSGKTVTFNLFGSSVGTAITDINGVATLTNVNRTGLAAGTYTNAVEARFAGDANYSDTSNTGPLMVNKATPVITWSNPSNIVSGAALSSAQLNATANVPGTFQYNPPAGTVLGVGTSQLSATFTPTDTANYTTATASVQITVDPQAAPALSLSSATYSVNEGDGTAVITITRTGNTSGAASTNYATSDTAGLQNCNMVNGIASSRCDYATSVGTLRFAAGETSKTISIPIVDDNISDGSENFTITLSNPTAASLGAISQATITITDNANTSGNPLDQSAFFVRQHYIDFLGREPDPAGFQGWQNSLNNCPAGDKSCDRIEVSSGFFRSAEFQERGYFTYRFYSVALGRKPDYAEFIPDLAKVSGFLSDAEKEANKVAFINEFMQRQEFKTRYDSLTDPTAYVDGLLNTAGLQTHPSRDGWIASLQNNSLTRAQVLRQLAESAESYAKFYNEGFVVMQYFGYLRRDPDIAYLDWIKSMNQNGDYRSMIDGFVNSAEYRQRFGQ
jgi:uncharacterized delta-60 repeat protein